MNTNAASRLHRAIVGLSSTKSGNLIHALSEHFGASPPTPGFGMQYAELARLFGEASTAVSESEKLSEHSKIIYSEAVTRLSGLLNPSRFMSDWNSIKGTVLQETDIHHLLTLSDQLGPELSQEEIDGETLAGIREEAENLRNLTEASADLPKDVRTALLIQLDGIIQSINSAHIFGDDLFVKNVHQTLGSMMTHWNLYAKGASTATLGGFVEMMNRAGLVVSKVRTGAEDFAVLTELAKRFIPGNGGGAA